MNVKPRFDIKAKKVYVVFSYVLAPTLYNSKVGFEVFSSKVAAQRWAYKAEHHGYRTETQMRRLNK